MPIYEYEHIDTACALGHVFEREQSVHDERLNAALSVAGLCAN